MKPYQILVTRSLQTRTTIMPSKIHHYSPNLLAKLAIPRNSPFNNSSTIHPPIYLYINRPNQSRQSAPDQSVRQFYLPLPPLYGRATLAIEMGNRLETRMCVCVCHNRVDQRLFTAPLSSTTKGKRAEHVAILSGPYDSSGSIDTAERLASMHCSFLSNDKWRNSALQSSSFRQFPRDIAYFSLLYFPRLFPPSFPSSRSFLFLFLFLLF